MNANGMIALTIPARSLRKTPGQIPGKTQSLPFLSLEELKPHFFFDLPEAFESKLQILLAMSRRYLSPDTSFPLRNHRIRKRDHIDSFLQDFICKLNSRCCIIEHHRDDGMFSGKKIKTRFTQAFSEELCIVDQLIP